MAKMHVLERDKAQQIMDSMREMLERRLVMSAHAPCPVEFVASYIGVCAGQSCGKCTPCRVGLRVLRDLFDDVLNNRATLETLDLIESTARNAYLSSDCAIGYEAGEVALMAIQAFRDDFESHVRTHRCGCTDQVAVPCVEGCPAHVDVPGYIALIEAGRYTDAVRLIRKDNPLPLVCGMVCEHPCEPVCRRGAVDDPLNIRGLKRYAVDHADDYRPENAEKTGKRVAVIGGGPAGLSCAYYLARMGHSPVIYEQYPHLGGMMRYGIPNYRLPRTELDREVQWLLDCGIEVVYNHRVEGEELMRLKEEYDAVFLAIGAHGDKKLGLEHEDAEGVLSAVELLRDMAEVDGEHPDFTGQEILVVGGGNVAMDVARTSVRLGAKKVSVVYRRRVADMTAQVEEIHGALAEGCELIELHAPQSIQVDAEGRVTGLVVEPQIIGGYRAGRPAPRKADADPVVLKADRIIVAIGQDIESQSFEAQGLTCKWGCFVTNTDESIAGHDGLFAGGDCQTGPATVIKAVQAGKVAARNIDAYLGFDHTIHMEVELAPVRFKSRIACARCNMAEREAGDRRDDFEMVEHTFTNEEAAQEASRCLHCDHFGFGGFRGGRIEQW